jgi:trimethylguanosine synthase
MSLRVIAPNLNTHMRHRRIADHLAQIAPPEKTILIDAFGGAGGNAIAFALSKRWKQIFYIEKNPQTLKCARHNAEVYGVKNKIMFIQGDCFEILSNRFQGKANQAVVFASPPWGGTNYKDDLVFDLDMMEPYSLQKLHGEFLKISPDVALYLPRSSNLNQVAKYAKDGQELQAMHYCVDGASKVRESLTSGRVSANCARLCASSTGTSYG